MPTFSPELIQEITNYFKDIHHTDIDKETAIGYLSSLADLYESFLALSGQSAALPHETIQDR